MTVREMWDVNLGWKWDVFAQFLSRDDLGRIAAHELVEDNECVDEVYWNGSPSGGFSLASALRVIRNDSEPRFEEVRGWRIMWKVEVPQRIKFFLWLASQDRLMTNSNRFLRNLTDDPRCFVCGEVEENTAHILRNCPVAILVWRRLGWRCNMLPGAYR